MKILIDDIKLNLLLEQKKDYIGKTIVWDSVVSAVSLLISVLLASYDWFGTFGVVLKTVFVILGLFFTVKSIVDIRKSFKDKYDFQDLMIDINKLNEIAHNHSIVVIKDSFNQYPNRFLVYEDKIWDCEFFLNYKENPNNEDFIRSHVSNELKINPEKISLTYVNQRIHEKYSESARENKIYSHKFYFVAIDEFPNFMHENTFECDGKTYHWRSISELEQDSNIKQKNMDILNYVKELF